MRPCVTEFLLLLSEIILSYCNLNVNFQVDIVKNIKEEWEPMDSNCPPALQPS